jgi:hypothetical protein
MSIDNKDTFPITNQQIIGVSYFEILDKDLVGITIKNNETRIDKFPIPLQSLEDIVNNLKAQNTEKFGD